MWQVCSEGWWGWEGYDAKVGEGVAGNASAHSWAISRRLLGLCGWARSGLTYTQRSVSAWYTGGFPLVRSFPQHGGWVGTRDLASDIQTAESQRVVALAGSQQVRKGLPEPWV